MRIASFVATFLALCLPSLFAGKELRVPSPDHRFVAVYHYSAGDAQLVESVSFADSSGQTLFRDDYSARDYRPETGQWSSSGRFFVYSLFSRGGHSPWHRPFIVADMRTRLCSPEEDLGAGDCVSRFALSVGDRISYHILDRSKDDWASDIPSIPVTLSLSEVLTHK